jgi:hypothetical protein
MVVMAETIVGCFAINNGAVDMETLLDNKHPFVETSARQLKKLHLCVTPSKRSTSPKSEMTD